MRKILRFDQLDSTNAYAKRNCSLIADQSIIVAKTQTAGRGRLSRIEALVLGVGINVSQKDLSRAGQPAVSLSMLGLQQSEGKILDAALEHFFAQYETVLQNGFSAIRAAYLKHFPYIGKEVKIQNGPTPARGTVETISPEGKLVLHTPEGQTIISIGDMCI